MNAQLPLALGLPIILRIVFFSKHKLVNTKLVNTRGQRLHLAQGGGDESGDHDEADGVERGAQVAGACGVKQVSGDGQAGNGEAAPEAHQPLLLHQEVLREGARAHPLHPRIHLANHHTHIIKSCQSLSAGLSLPPGRKSVYKQ